MTKTVCVSTRCPFVIRMEGRGMHVGVKERQGGADKGSW